MDLFFLPPHLQVCALIITEVLDRHENIRHMLQVLVDTNSQLFQVRKWERKPDPIILVNVKCLMHSACPTMRETIPFCVCFSAFNKHVCAGSHSCIGIYPQRFLQHTAKGEWWYSLSYGFIYNTFHDCGIRRQDLLVQHTPSHSLCKQAKTSDVCAHVFIGKKSMKVGGTSLLNWGKMLFH